MKGNVLGWFGYISLTWFFLYVVSLKFEIISIIMSDLHAISNARHFGFYPI